MKHQTLILSMALLTAVTLVTSCYNEDSIADGGTIPFTATLAPKSDNGSQTRAITTGTDANDKEILNVAWEVNEKIALYYQTTSGYAKTTAKVTEVNDGVATISATLDATATDGGTVKLVYPASLANETGDDIDESKLMTQYGLLTNHAYSISKRYDAATGEGKISLSGGTLLPTSATITNTEGTDDVSLKNRVCICKFHLSVYTIGQYGTLTTQFTPMNDDLTINDGNGHTYTIKSQKDWPGGIAPDYGGEHPGFQTGDDIYVAMLPVTSKSLTFSATGTIESVNNKYSLTTKPGTLVAGKFYRNVPAAIQSESFEFTGNFTQTLTVPDGITAVINSASFDITDGTAIVLGEKSKLILKNTTINVTSGQGIKCNGNATIILDGTNSVTTTAEGYPAIQPGNAGTTLTFYGSGSLTAIGARYAAAIGAQGDTNSICGNITISGGTITAEGGMFAAAIGSGAAIPFNTSSICGDILINGGTVTAIGGSTAAAIGCGKRGQCGNVTITDEVTLVTAYNRSSEYPGPYNIGTASSGTCGTITIGGTTYYDGTNFVNDGDTYLATSPFTYQP